MYAASKALWLARVHVSAPVWTQPVSGPRSVSVMVMVHTVAHITITTVVMMTRLSIAILSPTSYAVVAPKPVAPESARPAVRGRFAAVLAVVVRARPVYSLTAKSVRAVVFLQRRRLNFRSGGLQHPAPETVRLARKHQSAIVRTHPISNSRARGKLPSRLHTKRVMMLVVHESRRVVHLMMIEVLRIRLLEVLVVRHRVEEIVVLLLLLLRHWELLLRLLLRSLVRSVSSSWSR